MGRRVRRGSGGEGEGVKFSDLRGDEWIFASISGGRTSHYMRWWLGQRHDPSKIITLFANTGREHPRTLDFVKRCDDTLGFSTVWLEAVVHPEANKGTTHRIVTHETASRNGEPYEEMIKKYGIPNVAFPHCTRELKLRPMHSYLHSIGHSPTKIPTAIGIRADERRRVKGHPNVFYVLIDPEPTDKEDVIDWWSDYPEIDLDIDEFEGNCRGCFKKSDAKHFAQFDRDPSVYEWTAEMERRYAHSGAGVGPRVFFRGNRSTEQLIKLRRSIADGFDPARHVADGGCSESCELYETETAQLPLDFGAGAA